MDTRPQFDNQPQQQERDAISPDMTSAFHVKHSAEQSLTGAKTLKTEFTKDELYELNDALNETVGRMLQEGQTPEEIKYRSLACLWNAWLKITIEIHGTADTPAMKKLAALIDIAIDHPKTLISPTRR
ncbi:MAG: hypothetical protein Q8S20_01670 [Sulfuritalea sp.]|nr:hypothetical protein [Sulfuritalea sp.]